MKHSSSLPSPLKITAEVDAALALAGLAGPQVEREAIPLYLSFVFEMINHGQNDSGANWDAEKTAQVIEEWAHEHKKPVARIEKQLSIQLDEVLGLCKIHSTLSDFKRRELLKFHQHIIDYLQQPTTLIVNHPL